MSPSNRRGGLKPALRGEAAWLKRRTQKIRVFANEASLERLVSAILVEIDEQWAASRQPYLNLNNTDA